MVFKIWLSEHDPPRNTGWSIRQKNFKRKHFIITLYQVHHYNFSWKRRKLRPSKVRQCITPSIVRCCCKVINCDGEKKGAGHQGHSFIGSMLTIVERNQERSFYVAVLYASTTSGKGAQRSQITFAAITALFVTKLSIKSLKQLKNETSALRQIKLIM